MRNALVYSYKRIEDSAGQATLEAALLMPSIMFVMALLLEPVCLGYTKILMQHAAHEALRITAYDRDGKFDEVKRFIERRLTSVPELSLFHVGGSDDWKIDISRADKTITVCIAGHARPLPLMGAVLQTFSKHDDKGILLEVQAKQEIAPEWVGGSYEELQKIWG